MPPNDQTESLCPGPGCSNTLKQTGVGRKRRYCSDGCGARYRRQARLLPPADNDAYAAWAVEELRTLMGRFDVTSGSSPQASLELLVACEQTFKDLKTAVVLQSRDHKLKMPDIADTLHISPDTLSRMLKNAPDRRERRLPPPTTPPSKANKPAPSPRHPRPGPDRARRPQGGTGDADGAAPGHGPAATLASALSHLLRTSGLTHKALGDTVGVDPSYISRVVSGERVPSWKVTRRLARAFETDVEALRPLWDAARGYRVVKPAFFHAALRGLHLAAACPAPDTIEARAQLPAKDITAVLQGSYLPDWATVDRLVSALHGQPDTIRPLWEAARSATAPEPSTSFVSGCRIPVGTFG
ncbi:helix-turn-helix transcriptional regulator [Streptomyces sp. RTGN2]|uniref:helix-turn-helix domain-containing protein n=1 Tax=Streptomyces sp. RTGN2 TaxID=3016525 RepID=UPI002555E713|nr:helix-turn-helix transcriptional regulator [Streptomyces sp. RTGN2]